MHYRLSTLLTVLAIAPPVMAGWWLIISKETMSFVIALVVCLLICIAAIGPILVAWSKHRN